MNASKLPHDYTAKHLANVPRSGIRDFFDIVSSRPDVISLGIGEPDFVTPWHIREAASFALDHGSTAYTSNLGMPELRNAIAQYVKGAFNISYNPLNEVIVTVGSSEAMDLAIRAITNPGDEIIYHEPSYVSYSPIIRFSHGVPIAVSTSAENGFRLTGKMIEKKITPRSKAIILNFPTNPTGAVLTAVDVKSIAKIAIKHNLMVITDEIYSELTYGRSRVSIASIPEMKERTIFLHGLSKAWAMTGFRLGYACGKPAIIEAMMKIHQYTMMCAPTLSQKAGIEALANGNTAMQEMKNEYESRRNFIVNSLNGMGLSCHMPHGAFYAFPSIKKFGLSSKDFALRLLNEKQVACVPGTAFGASGEGYIRCSYATDIERIKEAMKRMAEFTALLRRKSR